MHYTQLSVNVRVRDDTILFSASSLFFLLFCFSFTSMTYLDEFLWTYRGPKSATSKTLLNFKVILKGHCHNGIGFSVHDTAGST